MVDGCANLAGHVLADENNLQQGQNKKQGIRDAAIAPQTCGKTMPQELETLCRLAGAGRKQGELTAMSSLLVNSLNVCSIVFTEVSAVKEAGHQPSSLRCFAAEARACSSVRRLQTLPQLNTLSPAQLT